jgi:hypothetical protein
MRSQTDVGRRRRRMRKEEGLLSRGVTERSQVRKESNREETG